MDMEALRLFALFTAFLPGKATRAQSGLDSQAGQKEPHQQKPDGDE